MALANMLDPSLYSQQLQAQQQQQLAQLLMQQGLSPMGGTESVGGVAIRRSPMEGMAKLAALLSGQSMQGQANDKTAAMMASQGAAMRAAFGMGDPQAGQPQGQPSPQALGAALGGSPPAAPSSPAGAMGLPGMSPMQSMMSYSMDPSKYMDSYLKGYTPNDMTVQARQGGFDPQMANRLAFIKQSTDPKILGMQQAGMSPEMIYRAILGEAAKGAEIDRKAGNQFNNPLTGESGMVPKIPENANMTGPLGANGAIPGLAPIPGAPGVIAANSAAQTAGTNTQTPETGYVNGQPVNTTRAARVASAVPPQVQASRDAESLKIIDAEISQATDPVEKATLGRVRQRLIAGAPSIAPEQGPGVVPGANAAQKELGDRFTAVREGAANAQTTTAYLQTIKGLADKAATGQFSDRIVFLNSLLSQVGAEQAKDATTANNLLDKYSNQIVARLGQGGLGTDAARAILASAYPNAKMNPAAIKEAADNIIGVNEMMKAKLTVLSPAGNARDPLAYQQAEAKFDKVADPRVFQIVHMPPDEAAKFLAKLPKEVQADLRARARLLKDMGVF